MKLTKHLMKFSILLTCATNMFKAKKLGNTQKNLYELADS